MSLLLRLRTGLSRLLDRAEHSRRIGYLSRAADLGQLEQRMRDSMLPGNDL